MAERESERGWGVNGVRTETETGRETERDTQRRKRKSLLPFFCCGTAVYPGLVIAIPARAKASSSLEKKGSHCLA